MALDHDIALLSRIPLFGAMGEEPLRLIAFSSETRTLRAGDVLFREGQAADAGFVVTEGRIGLADQGRLASNHTAGPGALIGEMALLLQTVRPATATALEPTTVMRIPRPLFRRVLEEFPKAARAVRAEVRARMEATTADLERARGAFLAIR